MPVTISYTFPDAFAPRIIEAFCVTYGYQQNVLDPDNPGQTIPNPETAAEFARRKVAEYTKEVITAYETKKTQQTLATAAVEAVKQEIQTAEVVIDAVQE